ncbi:hypothetical protein FXW78_18195 [Rhodococcus opacus]|nr:hypothetical protein [Rhodococcus opacus]
MGDDRQRGRSGRRRLRRLHGPRPLHARDCRVCRGLPLGADLRRAAEACIEERTPFVLVKVGTSDQGAAAALSHTGHLAGSDAALDAFFEQYSIHRVHDLDELLEVTTVLARTTVVPPVDGVALTSASGGANAHLVDLLVSSGLRVPELSPNTQDALRALIPGTSPSPTRWTMVATRFCAVTASPLSTRSWTTRTSVSCCCPSRRRRRRCASR